MAVLHVLAESNCTDLVSQLADSWHLVVVRSGGTLQRLGLARAPVGSDLIIGSVNAVAVDALAGRDRNGAPFFIAHRIKTLESSYSVLFSWSLLLALVFSL